MENSNPSPTKTRREAAVLVFVVFLLGLLVGGLGSHLWGERVWGHSGPAGGHSGPPSRDQIVNDLTHELQLTPDQQKQLSSIIDDTRSQMSAEHEKLRLQGRVRIRAILTPEQQPKFDAFMQRIDEQRKKDAAHQ